jgi:hypothetical protein
MWPVVTLAMDCLCISCRAFDADSCEESNFAYRPWAEATSRSYPGSPCLRRSPNDLRRRASLVEQALKLLCQPCAEETSRS